MGSGISLKWVLMSFLIGMAMVPVNSQSCGWLTPSASSYVITIECETSGTVVRLWENCPPGEELFTITNGTITLDESDCSYASGNPTILLKTPLDAEDGVNSRSCGIVGGPPKLFFDVQDINERPPYPFGDTLSVMEVDILENTPAPHDITRIYYNDDDKGETETLETVLISSEYSDVFTLVKDSVDANKKAFLFKAMKELDFEEQVFYKVEYTISSKDGNGTELGTLHTFFVYVGDAPDNPPFWSGIVPFYKLDECQEEDYLFSVTAQDRDVEVNYNIGYSFTEGSEYFEINQTTGQVRKKTAIDREDLLEIGISSFSLAIVATEYKETGEVGEEPNSNEQATIITIQDCNDEIPEFSNYTYEIEMNEVTDGNQDILSFVVKDMDEGINGTFTLETDQPDHVIIAPEEGQQTQEVTLTALRGSSLFDYENQKNTSFSIKITATEKKDSSHNNTSTVTITLTDVNDENPVFLQNTYPANVPEGTALNTYVLTVEADDKDVSPDYGKDSIRYILDSPCNEFAIDPETGNVTLNADLDFEDTTNGNGNLIECTVTARDEYGAGLKNKETTKISITINDVVDERPRFVDPGDPMEILENSKPQITVGSFTVTDADAEASISFDIQKEECTGGSSSMDVNGWFEVLPDPPSQTNFPARVVVGDVEIDREACKEVTLTIKATDDKTDEKYESESSATESFVITILDEIDESPIVDCKYGCGVISIDEVNEIDPSSYASVLVTTLTVTDPDEEDTIYLSLREGDEFVYLSKENVSVQAGSVAEIDIFTKKDANINCEAQQTIPIEIFMEDSENHNATIKINVTVNDLNDNRPEIDAGLCGGEPLLIKEDDGSGEINGNPIGMITATDKDEESPHNHVRYMMLNDQYSDSKNTWTPFSIDEETGNVTILLINGVKALDREQYADWELFFRAYDECDDSPTCKVLQSEPDCLVKITVVDVNDNYPRDLTWLPDGPITVNDFLQQDQDIGYVFTALDDDEGENANLTYFVKGTYRLNSDQDMDLFRAEEDPFSIKPSCRLFANKNFEGMNFTGQYTVTLEATDGGNLSTPFNLSINVEDANDKTPYFVFGGCAGEPEDNVIKMVENAYTPGENGQPEKMEVKCSKPDGKPFTITIQDDDPEFQNQKVTVEVDMVNSTAEGLAEGVIEQELLSYWSLYPNDCESGCKLMVSHLIDREKATAYNLSLHVRNTATPQKESWDYVRVVVNNEQEYDPYFCRNGNCSQVVYMYENNPDVYTYFQKATDEDNNDVSLGDDEYNYVYYYIVGGDKNYFQTVNDYEEKIVLKNMPDGLDREYVEEYTLQIHATNTEGDNGDNYELPRNDTLNLIIRVGDVNDNDPDFSDDVIFTSFMQSNKVDDRISTIEANDPDLNETLTYGMLNDLRCFETDFVPDAPFRIERKDDRSVYLILNFDPKGMSQGYCNFTIHVEDSSARTDETVVKVYVINEDYQVAMYFSNDLEEVQSKKKEIEDIYSSVYSYECTIDSIAQTQSTTGEILANKTTVYMHFIDEEKNEPVEDKIILDLSDNAETMTQLLQRLNLIGIQLDSVDTYTPNTNAKGAEEKVKELQILLGVVSLVLGLFVLLLATVYWLRTNKLERKIKVLSTNTFGSKDEGLNQMGLEMAAVPGSNYLAKEHGNHNPVFSESGGLEFKSQDTESISSGDSVLVGVEDNPEFKSYLAKGTTASSSKGFENPAYGRSIDDVSAGPPGVQGGMKGNPLLNLGVLKDETSRENVYDRDSLGSQDNSSSVNENINLSY